jgi:hypothetical protein
MCWWGLTSSLKQTLAGNEDSFIALVAAGLSGQPERLISSSFDKAVKVLSMAM